MTESCTFGYRHSGTRRTFRRPKPHIITLSAIISIKLTGRTQVGNLMLIRTYHAVPLPCRVAKDVACVFSIWIAQRATVFDSYIPCRSPAVLRLYRLATQGHGKGTAWNVWINIGRLSTACERSVQVRFLSTTTRSFTFGSSEISIYTRTFTKDTEDGRGTAWYVWISLLLHNIRPCRKVLIVNTSGESSRGSGFSEWRIDIIDAFC